MVRGGKVGSKSNFNRKSWFKDDGSDGSDEDYVVSDEGDEASDDESKDYCSSLDERASEESLGSFIEEEEEVARRIIRSTVKKSSAKKKFGEKTSRKRNNASVGVEDDEDFVEDEDEEDDDDDDEEFTPDEDDSLDEEEELTMRRKAENRKVGRHAVYRRPPQGHKKGRKSATQKKHSIKKGRRKRGLKRKLRVADVEDDVDFIDECTVTRRKSKSKIGQKRRKYHISSDSDFVSPAASDYHYTISEEEREQVMEANILCASVKSNVRSSLASKKTPESEDSVQCKKPLRGKGKEKVEEVKVKTEVVKQVCGICLSEEDKRRLRGTLDCCSHYFCFTCIMEWSKVESRCPLCKQRFKTITKPTRLAAGVDLRDVVIQVPERDQVYQPSEEELRSYIDPYENVICSECHQGGDDALMLLCDLCDSSAHTYCVGLGREVPEGNWYCDGCRPVALGSSSSQTQEFLPDQRTLNNNLYSRPSPVVNLGEGLDPTILPSPRTPLTQAFSSFSSPRFPAGDGPVVSPVSGAGAPTLSGRRWIHRHIQSLLSSSRLNYLAGRADSTLASHSSNGFINPSVTRAREIPVQQSSIQETGPSFNGALGERLQEDPSSSVQSRDFFLSRLGQLRRHAVQSPVTPSMDSNVSLTLWPELAGMRAVAGSNQISQWSTRSNVGFDSFGSPLTARDESILVAKEQLQAIVKTHLKNLSQDIQLGHCNLKDIAASSMQTVLAACGFEHGKSEVPIVPPPLVCSHGERVAAGQTSLMKGCCSTCFDSFVKDVVKRIVDTTSPQWLSLGI